MLISFTATLLHLMIGILQGSGAETPRFRYVLPADFSGWACVDFGVAGAPPLKRDGAAYVLEPSRGAIQRTSSLPHLADPPVPFEVIRIVNGSSRRVESDASLSRSEYDSKSPVSRHCQFFGPSASVTAVPRPPTLAESRLGTDPVLQHFDFLTGDLCEFRDSSRLCLAASDFAGSDVRTHILRALGPQSAPIANRCDGFAGIIVRYHADRALQTHSSAAGPRSAFAEVRRERAAKGTTALATWSSMQGGSAAEMAEQFGRHLADLFRHATSDRCAK